MLGSKAQLQASKVFPVEQKQKEETEAQFCKKKMSAHSQSSLHLRLIALDFIHTSC